MSTRELFKVGIPMVRTDRPEICNPWSYWFSLGHIVSVGFSTEYDGEDGKALITLVNGHTIFVSKKMGQMVIDLITKPLGDIEGSDLEYVKEQIDAKNILGITH